jgi:hypothetical protein
LRDALTGFLPRIARISRKQQENSLNSPNSRQEDTDLWALKDVSFEVKRGEVMGRQIHPAQRTQQARRFAVGPKVW